ncbi:exosome complex component MTR3 [Dunckerocampus dactyliophorus]|uniref:exosome complex component MTR3 n=1 Tax=Dunckerocampus dactyliophorus TaxID=161453 RepID=UPI0024057704|nr:exosome complex component MTR3 [Dunckerocampus dactyliophorus]
MPVDTKRVRGPDVSQSPSLFARRTATVVSSLGPRADGRQRDQVDVRPVFVRCGLVSQAKGSAYMEAGDTKLMCCVYGPRETERKDETDMKCGRLTTDMRFAPFSCPDRGSWIQGSQDKDFSLMLHESLQPALCLHKYPRSQIEVNVMVLENSGSVLAHAVTCASLALADAGIEMYDLVLGCAIRQDGGSYVVDPTYTEENGCGSVSGDNQGKLTVAFLPSLNQVSGLQSDGEMTEETLSAGVRTCIEGCYKIYPVIQQALAKAVWKVAPPPSES